MSFIINPYRFAAAGGGGVLDSYSSNLMVAHSVSRRLLTSYTGALFKVRRSSDNATQDISYGVDNWADTAALASFIGANSGYIDTLYDQSGNGRHMSQGTVSAQFRVVNAGVNDTLGGKLTLFHSGPNWTMMMATTSTFTSYTGTTMSVFARGLNGIAANNYRFVSVTNNTSTDYLSTAHCAIILSTTVGIGWQSYRAASLANSIVTPATSDGLISAIADGTNLKLRDGTNTGSAASSAAFNINRVLIGGYTNSNPYAAQSSKFAEVILWTSDQTSNEAAIRSALTY